MSISKEEFIGIAADAILAQRVGRLLVAQVNDEVRYEAVQWASAALRAVGAWEMREAASAQVAYDDRPEDTDVAGSVEAFDRRMRVYDALKAALAIAEKRS